MKLVIYPSKGLRHDGEHPLDRMCRTPGPLAELGLEIIEAEVQDGTEGIEPGPEHSPREEAEPLDTWDGTGESPWQSESLPKLRQRRISGSDETDSGKYEAAGPMTPVSVAVRS